MTRFRQTLTGAAVATALLASLSMPSFAQTAAPAADQATATQAAPATSITVVTSAVTVWST